MLCLYDLISLITDGSLLFQYASIMALFPARLSKKDLESIARSVGYEGIIESGIVNVAGISKDERLEIIRSSTDQERRRTLAAVEIQRCWRGYYTRSVLLKSLGPAVNVTQSTSHTTTISLTKDQAKSSSQLLASYHSYEQIASPIHDIPKSFQEFCAEIIQRWWRKNRRKRNALSEPQSITSLEMTSSRSSFDENFVGSSKIRVALMKPSSEMRTFTQVEAAAVIQRSWRKHVDVQVYRYYKDLINFKCEGNPSLMLRCINPRESSLLDSATGAYIRFRLGGENFPPYIYYKVFTCRNIADIGAFAPRDYTNAGTKQLPMKFIHNKGIELNDYVTKKHTGWYQRSENNGWRLVSDKALNNIYQDPITFSTSKKKVKFHHCKLVRKQDLEKRQKERKMEWMKKMYRDGALKAKEEDSNIKALVESAAQGVLDAAPKTDHGHGLVEEWEVDELLQWTNGLNFEEYNADWRELSTTDTSSIQGRTRNPAKDLDSMNSSV